jgi:uncharacterized protein
MKTIPNAAGLGLRREFALEVADALPGNVSFYEVAPENWMKMGGKWGRLFRSLSERFPFIFHGLSLSLGGYMPLDTQFIAQLKIFLQQHQALLYSEHLSYCGDDGLLYDLLPIPFTEEAVHHVSARIRRTQDLLDRRIAIENVSYYAAPGKEMEEIDFINAVLDEADCLLLLDINNIYVNSVNHGYDALAFLQAIPGERIAYAHIAGHYVEAEDFLIDTHGAAIIDPVWTLLKQAYELFGVFPTLLERDFNIPPLPELLKEVGTIKTLQSEGNSHATR